MKTYHLRLTQSDFTRTGNTWRSQVYDLYYNNQYKNYSITKAAQGTDLLGTGVYTGLNKYSASQSEIGTVESGRFIDTSARIDIVSWQLDFTDDNPAGITSFFNVFTSTNSTATPAYLGEWTTTENILPGNDIYVINSGRYAFFELDMTSDMDLSSIEFEVFVIIEIDAPTINGYFTGTRSLQNKFPEWMTLREYDPSDPLGATPATPTTVGGSFLNAVAGEWLTDLSSKLQYQQYQLYINSVDVSQKDWVYRAVGLPTYVYSIQGDGLDLSRAASIQEYHQSLLTEDACFWNLSTKELYVNKNYTTLTINGTTYELTPYHVWNSLDDIGTTVDLFRLPSESNTSFKSRILDVYKNPSGVSADAFKLAIRRELNLWKYYGSTPDSDYQGATPNVLEMGDILNDASYFDADGMPTAEFIDLVTQLAEKYPLTWGYFLWDQAFWDADGVQNKGFSTLPRRLDATPVTEPYRESGVGDGNDLFMFKPQGYTGPNQFTGTLKLRGRQKTTRSEYIPLTFGVKVYGTASENYYSNPSVTGNFTIEITLSGVVYYCPITITTQNNTTYYATPNSSGTALLEWTTPDGFTDIAFPFRNYNTNVLYGTGAATPSNQINLRNVTRIEIKKGWYGGPTATPAYTNTPTDSQYRLWFIQTPGTWIGQGSVGTSLLLTSFNWQTTIPSLRMQSQSLNYFMATPNATPPATPNTWVSDNYLYTVTLNGVAPNMTQQNFVLTLPKIIWPASTINRQYVIELTTFNGTTFGAYSDANASTPTFVPSTQIAVNGSTAWTIGGKAQSISYLATTATFSSSFAITSSVWSLFEATQITKNPSGLVDENGPYIGGRPAPKLNKNFRLSTLKLSRDDFGIPNTTNYIVTWIGVDSVSNNNVTMWLDTNSVLPAVTDQAETGLNIVYPTDTVVEVYSSTTGKYSFSDLPVYAKLKVGINDTWNPKLYSGYFYDDIDEYYLYANPTTESATANTAVLKGLNRQGAPLIIQAVPSDSSWSQAVSVPLSSWSAVANDGNSTYVAVATSGTNQIMRSSDNGLSWTSQPALEANSWIGVTYGNGLFVAVASTGTHRVMTSPDGITWTLVTAPGTGSWRDITYGNGLFVAVSNTSGGSVMTSPNGTTWTLRTAPAIDWWGVTYGNGLFVAVGINATYQIMTSSDGFTWTGQAAPEANSFWAVGYGNGLFVAVAGTGTNRIITSPDGVTWTGRLAPENNTWYGISYSDGLFVAIAQDGVHRYMTSNNGITWTQHTAPGTVTWIGVSGNDGKFVAVGNSGTNRVMLISEPSTEELRQVAFWNDSTPSTATPTTSTTQTVLGNGTTNLYVAYYDIYNITVWDNTIAQTVALASNSSIDNIVRLTQPSKIDHEYEITYTVRFSYAVDNDYVDTDGLYKSRILFDRSATDISSTYSVSYETSIYDPATPVDISLNPMYTSIDEGFVFIDHDVRPLGQVEVKISPSALVADGLDYALITLRSFDNVGNPKPFQTFKMYTNWGTIDKTTVTTDRDGFGYATLTSKVWAGGAFGQGIPSTPNALIPATPGSVNQGLVLATIAGMDAKAAFQIQLLAPSLGKVVASMDSASIISDGKSATTIFGLVEDSSHRPVSGITVYWNKARTIYELFKNRKLVTNAATPGSVNLSGSVVTDSLGRFTVGPFVSSTQSGYWFVSTEAFVPATPSSNSDYRGDVVYWYEYPNITSSIDIVSSNIVYPTQSATPSFKIPQYSLGSAFPTTYDEATPRAITAATPSIVWTPPKWYAIDKYKQYQMGLLGNAINVIAATPVYPSYKEI